MRYCPIFKQKIKELKEKAEPLDDLLLKYKETGDEEMVKELEISLKEIEEFKEEFVKRVYELLEKWYPKKEKLNEFLKNIKINEKGRVETERLDVSYCNLSSLYLPSLFEKIKEINCHYNRLTSLPKLPNSLKVLYRHNNELTSLPELPDGLKELICEGNLLTKETIERIKSHPNYDPYFWTF